MKKYNPLFLLLIITCGWVNISANNYEPQKNRVVEKSTAAIAVNFPIVSGEYFFNGDPGVGNGTKISINQSDSIAIDIAVPVSGINPGFNNLFIRVQDDQGIWSLSEGRIVYVQPTKVLPSETPLASGEYFFDTDPGVGNGEALSGFNSSEDISLTNQISVAGLTEGFHNLFIRIKDTSSEWSLYEGRVVYVQPTKAAEINNQITKGEYFFDNDPGVGNGIAISGISDSDNISLTSPISAESLSPGFHNLFVRVKDKTNVWSLYEARIVYVQSEISNNAIAPITKGEYFFDTDPGVGNGIPLSAFAKADSISIVQQMTISDIPIGTNNLFVRTMDSLGVWSMYIVKPIAQIISGVNDITDDGISIYPNPVKSEFVVVGADNINLLDIYDLTGKLVLSKNIEGNKTVSVEHLQSGLYVVHLYNGTTTIKRKLIKK